ncbi:serine hydrolase [Maritimibacter sp. HL-12]|jgi:CubicO group peptidase (beta-lactamase class C family)|uniref:serine hydrolase domain-containing protein n=1 Tax=Maritimibacter sp. HL-12 TaxID=1162418 RepID=UPI000A0F2652|nr:serine hydrolase domain-containing protein [Maritimibacter sp. HL-12]SMH42394.1 CubicO group peptidase, beta-lactamase class C family [Maritimibacter sp. HL-12]
MTHIYRRAVPLALGAALLLGVAAEATPAPGIDAVLDRWVESGRIAGAVALVAKDGEIVYRRAAGHADREAGMPVTEDTIFRHASMTKLITSATALALVDRGRLSLDAPVTDWLPWFTPALPDGRQPTITIRHLMTHTAGLSYVFLEPQGNAYETLGVPQGLGAEDLSLEEALRRLAEAPLFFEPGSEWRYSLGTDVLGAVIEEAAGMPLPEAVRHYVTGPLGMADTTFVVTEPDRLSAAYRDGDDVAERMADEGDLVPLGEAGVPVWPARVLDAAAYPSGGGGMSGTAGDYLALLEVIRTGGAPILSEAAARDIGTHAIGNLRAWTEGDGWGHGLGAAVLLDAEAADTPQTPGTFQWGGALGSHWFVDPAVGLTVVVLTNTSVAGVIGDFPAEMRDAIYATYAE